MANSKILSQLMLNSYEPLAVRHTFNESGFKAYGNGQDLSNGLRIQAYKNDFTKEVVIGVAGTNGLNDMNANKDFVFGGYNDQFREAVKYAYDVKTEIGARPDGQLFNFDVAAHSLGGGIGQVLSHTFGWGGLTADAPAASGIIESAGYFSHLQELGIEPQGAGHLVNYTENGSLVSSIPGRNYIGDRVEINLTPDGQTLLGGAALLVPNPIGTIVGGGLIVDDQWIGSDSQHSAAKFAQFLSNPQDPSDIAGWHYVGGTYDGWYRTPPGTYVGQNDWIDRADPDQAAALFAERARRMEHNRALSTDALDFPPSPNVDASGFVPLPSHSSAIEAPNVYTDVDGNTHYSYSVGSGANGSSLNPGDLVDVVTDTNGNAVSWTRTYATGDTVVREEYTRDGTMTRTVRDAEDGTLLSREVTSDATATADPYFDQFQNAFADQAARDAEGRPADGEPFAFDDTAGHQTDAGLEAPDADADPQAAPRQRLPLAAPGAPAEPPAWTLYPDDAAVEADRVQQTRENAAASGFASALSFMQALQNDNEFAATIAAISMVNQFSLAGGGSQTEYGAGLGAGLGAISAGINIYDAWQQGDMLGVLAGSAQFAGQIASIYAQATGSAAATGFAKEMGPVGAALGLFMALDSGDEASIAASTISLLVALEVIPVWGTIIAVAITMFNEPDRPPAPRIWGEGALLWDEEGHLDVATRAGEHSNDAAYDRKLDDFRTQGMAPVKHVLNGIKAQLDAYTESHPEMGVIPTRLPILHYEQTLNELTLSTIDAETGEVIQRRFDAQTGFPCDRLEGPEALETLFEVYLEMAEHNLAIAPRFEVEEARAQYLEALAHPQPTYAVANPAVWDADSNTFIPSPDTIMVSRLLPPIGEEGDSSAQQNLTDGSLLSRMLTGELVAATRSEWYAKDEEVSPSPQPSPEGRGGESFATTLNALTLQTLWTEALADQGVAPTLVLDFGDGYSRSITLNSPDTGLLIVDLNNDGAIQEREVIRSLDQLARYDADDDGLLTAADPIYSALKLWSAVQHDPTISPLLSLEDAGLASLDFSSGQLDIEQREASILSAGAGATTQTLDLTDPVRYTAMMGAVFEETLTQTGKRETVHVAAVLRTERGDDATTIRLQAGDARVRSAGGRAPTLREEQEILRDRLARSGDSLFAGAGGLLTAFAVAPTAADGISLFMPPDGSADGSSAITAQTHRVTADELISTARPVVTKGTDENVVDVSASDLRSVGGNSQRSGDELSIDPVVPDNRRSLDDPLSILPIGDSDIAPVVLAPETSGETTTANEDATLRFDPRLLLANDRARSGDGELTITAVGDAAHGTVTFDTDGFILFTPDADYYGQASFTYTVTDQFGVSSQAAVTIAFDPVNDAPVASDVGVASSEDTILLFDPADLLANVSDVDDSPSNLTLAALSGATNGAVTLTADGLVRFAPTANYFGSASFTYTVRDASGAESTATVTLQLAAINDAPTVTGEIVVSSEDATLLIDPAALLANDGDVDNAQTELDITQVSGATGGVVSLDADGTVRFVPDNDFYGLASFSYLVSDGSGGESTAQVSLQITPNLHDVRVLEVLQSVETRIPLSVLLAGAVDNYQGDLNLTQVSVDQFGAASIDDRGTADAQDDEIVFTSDADYYTRAYNPALGRYQDLASNGLDPYSGALRDDALRTRGDIALSYTVEDQWGNAVQGQANIGVNYWDFPAVSTNINVEYGDVYGYWRAVRNAQGDIVHVYVPGPQTPTGANGQLAVDSPYVDEDITYYAALYSGNPPGALGFNQASGTWTFDHYNTESGNRPGYNPGFRSMANGETEWLFWAEDPAGNISERHVMLWGGYGDDGYIWDDSQNQTATLPHGTVGIGEFDQSTIPGTGQHGIPGGQTPVVSRSDGSADSAITVSYVNMASGDSAQPQWTEGPSGTRTLVARPVDEISTMEFLRYGAETQSEPQTAEQTIVTGEAYSEAELRRAALAFAEAVGSFQTESDAAPLGFIEAGFMNDVVAASDVADPYTGIPSG